MTKPWVVREVRLQRRCWPLSSHVAEAGLICPLCAIDKGTSEPTAGYTTTGHLACSACQRLCAIETNRGISVVPFSIEPLLRRQLAEQVTALKNALSGNGNLLDLIELDPEQPVVVVSFALERIHIAVAAEVSLVDRGAVNKENGIDRLGRRIPPYLRRVLDSGSSIVTPAAVQ